MLRKAIDAGFDVALIYIGIANPELSAGRRRGSLHAEPSRIQRRSSGSGG
jgi:hypothetical protein